MNKIAFLLSLSFLSSVLQAAEENHREKIRRSPSMKDNQAKLSGLKMRSPSDAPPLSRTTTSEQSTSSPSSSKRKNSTESTSSISSSDTASTSSSSSILSPRGSGSSLFGLRLPSLSRATTEAPSTSTPATNSPDPLKKKSNPNLSSILSLREMGAIPLPGMAKMIGELNDLWAKVAEMGEDLDADRTASPKKPSQSTIASSSDSPLSPRQQSNPSISRSPTTPRTSMTLEEIKNKRKVMENPDELVEALSNALIKLCNDASQLFIKCDLEKVELVLKPLTIEMVYALPAQRSAYKALKKQLDEAETGDKEHFEKKLGDTLDLFIMTVSRAVSIKDCVQWALGKKLDESIKQTFDRLLEDQKYLDDELLKIHNIARDDKNKPAKLKEIILKYYKESQDTQANIPKLLSVISIPENIKGDFDPLIEDIQSRINAMIKVPDKLKAPYVGALEQLYVFVKYNHDMIKEKSDKLFKLTLPFIKDQKPLVKKLEDNNSSANAELSGTSGIQVTPNSKSDRDSKSN